MKKKVTRRKLAPLTPELLYTHCDASLLNFASTAELEDLSGIVGQNNAAAAIQFGVGIRHEGYNIYVLGPAGSGRYSLVRRELEGRAASMPAPADWCYLNNFDVAHKPVAVSLPAGRGARFQQHMHKFCEELRDVIPAAFESEEYRSHIEALNDEFKQRHGKVFEELGQEAIKQGIALIETPTGFSLAPFKDEQVLTPEEFEKLPESERQRFNQLIDIYNDKLRKIAHQIPAWQREHQARLRAYNRETIALAAGSLIEELRVQYADLPKIQEFLSAVQADLIENVSQLREQKPSDEFSLPFAPLQRYQVNLLVDHGDSKGAPVVFENNPTYQNLLGRIEHITHMGTLSTNFTLIKAGALQRANGGFLILNAGKLLSQPYAWEGLKRALLSREINIETLGEIFGLVSTHTLQPQPIPLDIKVVLFGERQFYYLLYQLDAEFAELFKVAADFEEEIDRTPENTLLYARMIATLVRQKSLRAFDRMAVARAIEQSARMVEDASKLLTHVRSLTDLLTDADYYAEKAGHAVVTAADVETAIAAQIHRAERLRKSYLNDILDGTVLIDTEGLHDGQINGLAAIDLGNYVFALPIRITATTRLGEGNVIDIEREVALSGAIHSKGVLILTAFLASRYSHSMPLSLNASLVFEQSYSSVEGDSASLAELCALLSALSGLPIYQGLAVTGSVNQYGQVQVIGAVNEKIEGFFDVCNARGLSGKQGVLIPAANVKHLMLRQDVVEAVRAGKFHVYAVENVDQAMELLTGVPAGEPDENGLVPNDTVNYFVMVQLMRLSQMRKEQVLPAPARRKTVRRKRSNQA
ncbi:MAG TPA: ATP-binding protein [Gallionellaceae bacterium]